RARALAPSPARAAAGRDPLARALQGVLGRAARRAGGAAGWDPRTSAMSSTRDSAEVLVIRRVLPVPRERVFAAWLDPVSLARWMTAGEGADITALDPRVGGKFRIVMRHRGSSVEHWGEYLAIDRPSLLSLNWVTANTHHRPSVA